ncbi:MAG: hypothetical protein LUC97_06185 [Clostridiales bacterium]|nr:hypothetical protein [Clostridiales bacterium]
MAARKVVRDESRLESLIKIKALKEKKESEGFEVSFKVGEKFIDDNGEEREKTEVIKIEPLPVDVIWQILNSFDAGDKLIDVYRSLCYAALPELHDKEILEAHGCEKDPESIIDVFLAKGDITLIGSRIKSVVDGELDIKNL